MSESNYTRENATFNSGNEVLAGTFIRVSEASKIQLLFLHGAGKASKERAMPLANKIAEAYRISSFLFDFSGHGESSGQLSDSSLSKRLSEAIDAVRFAHLGDSFSICAFSMGGHIALELLRDHDVANVFLFYSAVYSSAAFNIPFGEAAFSTILRTPDSWKESEAWDLLARFEGNLLVVSGENDDVVPSEIPKRLAATPVRAKSSKLITVPNAPHLLVPQMLKSPELFEEISSHIGACIRSQ
jgi:uncharacterized protein